MNYDDKVGDYNEAFKRANDVTRIHMHNVTDNMFDKMFDKAWQIFNEENFAAKDWPTFEMVLLREYKYVMDIIKLYNATDKTYYGYNN